MTSFFYPAGDPAEAFEAASRDPRTWGYDFATLEALHAMAIAILNGTATVTQMGVDPLYGCERGAFRVAARPNGFGVAVVAVTGYESGVEGYPAAAEVLAFHRYHRGQARYAEPLLVYSEHVETIEELDAAYDFLESDSLRPFVVRGGEMVSVTVGGQTYERPTFIDN